MQKCNANESVYYLIQYMPILEAYTNKFVDFIWNPSNQMQNIAFDRAWTWFAMAMTQISVELLCSYLASWPYHLIIFARFSFSARTHTHTVTFIAITSIECSVIVFRPVPFGNKEKKTIKAIKFQARNAPFECTQLNRSVFVTYLAS